MKKASAGVFVLGCVGLWFGWQVFWFLTDDAHIAFRYVSNSQLGHGYTWNAPPFRAVEGYTSFLWVALLDAVWRTTGIAPPAAANALSLAFSCGTLGLLWQMVQRMGLNEPLARWRPLWLGLVLLGTLTNRTFLAWTSSGLETALFHFLLIGWIVAATRPPMHTGRVLAVSATAGLCALARPDGLLVVAATLVMLVVMWGRLSGAARLATWPLAMVPAHLAWRLVRYGSWLPNTYHAKVSGAWPESGLRYLASFVLEYGLVIWIAVASLWLVRSIPRWREDGGLSPHRLLMAAPTLTLLAHVGYYSLIVGGDHFEYRVLAHLVPLCLVSMVWMLSRLSRSPAAVGGCLVALIVISWPLPWTHWGLTHALKGRQATHRLFTPVAPHLPPPLSKYAAVFDRLQGWLIAHSVCIRHQEHKEFYLDQSAVYPSRQEGQRIEAAGFPVHATGTVGVAGWTLPHVNVIDRLGLNDYVGARSPPDQDAERVMAHERRLPQEYLRALAPNVIVEHGRATAFPRRTPLTAERIREIEQEWWQRAPELTGR